MEEIFIQKRKDKTNEVARWKLQSDQYKNFVMEQFITKED